MKLRPIHQFYVLYGLVLLCALLGGSYLSYLLVQRFSVAYLAQTLESSASEKQAMVVFQSLKGAGLLKGDVDSFQSPNGQIHLPARRPVSLKFDSGTSLGFRIEPGSKLQSLNFALSLVLGVVVTLLGLFAGFAMLLSYARFRAFEIDNALKDLQQGVLPGPLTVFRWEKELCLASRWQALCSFLKPRE